MTEITRKAYAKINLSLDVLRKRPDGYHDLEMVMQTIGLYDEVTCRRRDDGQIAFSTDSGILSAEDAKDNLCVRAATLLAGQFACGGVDIFLKKNIPVAAGLAGGSTDAAAVMKAVNDIYGLKLSQAQLEELGVQLGADIPFTLRGGTVLCEGIGDVMTDLPPAPSCTVLLAKPDIQVSTGEVYGTLVLDDTAIHPDAIGQADAIRAGSLLDMADKCDNILARVTEKKHPVIPQLREIMISAGALNSIMSGSGPTVFGLFERRSGAENAERIIRSFDPDAFTCVTGFINDIEGEQYD